MPSLPIRRSAAQVTDLQPLDSCLDALLQEELASLRWSQAEREQFCASPLPGLIKQIVLATLASAWHFEKSSVVQEYRP